MKHPLLFCFALLSSLVFCACGQSPSQPAVPADRPGVGTGSRLFITSDVHYQQTPSGAQSLVIPQTEYIGEITDALLWQVVESKPDAFVLCGDLTNNGSRAEHEALAGKLQAVANAGIAVYVLPGNHDMMGVDAEEFAQLYGSLGYGGALSRDPSSLSYTALLPGGELLVLLDTNVYGTRESSAEGMVSGETLAWLRACLEQAASEGRVILSASHHNLLHHASERYRDSFRLDCPESLPALLSSYGARLHLSGHRHRQHIARQEEDGGTFCEIVSGMPIAYPNHIGELSLSAGGAGYQTLAVDVEGWAAQAGRTEEDLLRFSQYTLACGRKQAENMACSALSSLDLSDWERREMSNVFFQLQLASSENTLMEHQQALRRSQGYVLWMKYAAGTPWGSWMEFLLDNPAQDNCSLSLSW